MGKADDLTKHYIQQNDRFVDICNFYLFNGEQVIRSEDLQEQDTTELEVEDKEILDFVPDYMLNLIVPDEIKDFSKFTTELKTVLEFVGVSDNQNELRKFCEASYDAEISLEAANLLNVCFDARIETGNSKGGQIKMCKGLEDWVNESRAEGRAEGRAKELTSLVIDGLLDKEVAAQRLNMSLEEFDVLLQG